MASVASGLPVNSIIYTPSLVSRRLHRCAVNSEASFRQCRRFPNYSFSHQGETPFPVVTLNSITRNHSAPSELEFGGTQLDEFVNVGNQLADASGDVLRKYFRTSIDILDKDDLSPVTIADQISEESMASIIQANFPSHAIYGEENGWRCSAGNSEFVWVIDPIDGTKSFITGKPVFGTLIALVHQGQPIVGIIDQPILRERWIGVCGQTTTLNGQKLKTRSCEMLSQAYLYTTSPHLFTGKAAVAFDGIRDKVKAALYGCDCYAFGLLSMGNVDLVVESGLKPYDVLALIPVVEGAGGIITDWDGGCIRWNASPSTPSTSSFNVLASGDGKVHHLALAALQPTQWCSSP